jgi:rhodanese-related sulfurtransferase
LWIAPISSKAISAAKSSKILRKFPISELPNRNRQLDPLRLMVVHSQSGSRCAKAIAILHQARFARLENLTRGILEWIKNVDLGLPMR